MPLLFLLHFLLIPSYLFHFQRRHVERNCSESECASSSSLSLSFFFSFSSSLCFLYLSLSSFLPLFFAIHRLPVCLSRFAAQATGVSQYSIATIYIPGTYGDRTCSFSPLLREALGYSLALSAPSLALSYPPSAPKAGLLVRGAASSVRTTDIAIEERTLLRLPYGDITSIKYSQATCGCMPRTRPAG